MPMPPAVPMHEWTAREIAEAIGRRDVSAEEVTRHHLERIEARGELHAFITLDDERAIERARSLDRSPGRGRLAGVPFAPKDAFDTAGLCTTYGSAIFRDHIPENTAVSVQRLVDAGAIILGKANMNEFARGVTSGNPFYGDVRNPRRPGYTPAGSSGGNAAALAAGLVALSLATDAGGSIRAPAAACGVTGFKPRYGWVSLDGSFPLAAPFDHAGPMARTADDCALAMEVLVGMPQPAPILAGLRAAITHSLPSAVTTALEEAGVALEEATIPSFAHLIPVHLAEFAYTHRRLYPARAAMYTPECREMLDRGRDVSAIEYRALVDELAEWRRVCNSTLLYDLLVSPAMDGDPPRLGQREDHGLLLRMSNLTRPLNLLGWPAIVSRDGVMFAGRDDATVLGAAIAWENRLPSRPSTC